MLLGERYGMVAPANMQQRDLINCREYRNTRAPSWTDDLDNGRLADGAEHVANVREGVCPRLPLADFDVMAMWWQSMWWQSMCFRQSALAWAQCLCRVRVHGVAAILVDCFVHAMLAIAIERSSRVTCQFVRP